MSTFYQKLQYLSNTKAAIKAALVQKGVAVSDEDTFRSYASKILNISGGSGEQIEAPEGYTAVFLLNKYRTNISLYTYTTIPYYEREGDNDYGYMHYERNEIEYSFSEPIDMLGNVYLYVRNEDFNKIDTFNIDTNSTVILLCDINLRYKAPEINYVNFIGYEKIHLEHPIMLENLQYGAKTNINIYSIIKSTSETQWIDRIAVEANDDENFDFTDWDVSNVKKLQFNTGSFRMYCNELDLSNWVLSDNVDCSNMFYCTHPKVLKINNLDPDKIMRWYSMFSNFGHDRKTKIYCTQKFKNWAIEHADDIELPDYLRQNKAGSYKYPELFDWCIVDWTGVEPQLIDLLKVTGDDGLQIKIFKNNDSEDDDNLLKTFTIENGEAIISLYDVQLEGTPVLMINDNKRGIDYIENLTDGNVDFLNIKIYQLNRLGGMDEHIRVVGNHEATLCCDNSLSDYSNLEFTHEEGRFNINGCSGITKFPNARMNNFYNNFDNYVAIYMWSNQLERWRENRGLDKWVGPVDSNAIFRLYDYNENESYYDRNITLKDPKEWAGRKQIKINLYDGNNDLVTDFDLIQIHFKFKKENNGDWDGFYSSNNGIFYIDGYGDTIVSIGDDNHDGIIHTVVGGLPLVGNRYKEVTINDASPNVVEIELHTSWVYRAYTHKSYRLCFLAVDEDDNVIDNEVLNNLNYIIRIENYGINTRFGNLNDFDDYLDASSKEIEYSVMCNDQQITEITSITLHDGVQETVRIVIPAQYIPTILDNVQLFKFEGSEGNCLVYGDIDNNGMDLDDDRIKSYAIIDSTGEAILTAPTAVDMGDYIYIPHNIVIRGDYNGDNRLSENGSNNYNCTGLTVLTSKPIKANMFTCNFNNSVVTSGCTDKFIVDDLILRGDGGMQDWSGVKVKNQFRMENYGCDIIKLPVLLQGCTWGWTLCSSPQAVYGTMKDYERFRGNFGHEDSIGSTDDETFWRLSDYVAQST